MLMLDANRSLILVTTTWLCLLNKLSTSRTVQINDTIQIHITPTEISNFEIKFDCLLAGEKGSLLFFQTQDDLLVVSLIIRNGQIQLIPFWKCDYEKQKLWPMLNINVSEFKTNYLSVYLKFTAFEKTLMVNNASVSKPWSFMKYGNPKTEQIKFGQFVGTPDMQIFEKTFYHLTGLSHGVPSCLRNLMINKKGYKLSTCMTDKEVPSSSWSVYVIICLILTVLCVLGCVLKKILNKKETQRQSYHIIHIG
ncbi:uncharacterized protein LOC111086881 [Limulus polyphemus]|uniref:Uncharacterized protein LOC111086881 n=1 Tax=Limulus polyphemus TaxID=6850 RepID=A0ABM1SUE6_LIMPO|nr:uncharacterized protein LOC111086881 [Limulus polyphemus]